MSDSSPSRPPGEALEAIRREFDEGYGIGRISVGFLLDRIDAITAERDEARAVAGDGSVVAERGVEIIDEWEALADRLGRKVLDLTDERERAVTALREALKLSENIGGCPALGHLTDCLEAALAAASSPGENEGERDEVRCVKNGEVQCLHYGACPTVWRAYEGENGWFATDSVMAKGFGPGSRKVAEDLARDLNALAAPTPISHPEG